MRWCEGSVTTRWDRGWTTDLRSLSIPRGTTGEATWAEPNGNLMVMSGHIITFTIINAVRLCRFISPLGRVSYVKGAQSDRKLMIDRICILLSIYPCPSILQSRRRRGPECKEEWEYYQERVNNRKKNRRLDLEVVFPSRKWIPKDMWVRPYDSPFLTLTPVSITSTPVSISRRYVNKERWDGNRVIREVIHGSY